MITPDLNARYQWNGDNAGIETAAVEQQWTDKFSSSLSYGQVRGDRAGDLFPDSTRKLESVHFSQFYRVTDPVTLGFEVSHGRKERQSRESEDNTRLQFSA